MTLTYSTTDKFCSWICSTTTWENRSSSSKVRLPIPLAQARRSDQRSLGTIQHPRQTRPRLDQRAASLHKAAWPIACPNLVHPSVRLDASDRSRSSMAASSLGALAHLRRGSASVYATVVQMYLCRAKLCTAMCATGESRALICALLLAIVSDRPRALSARSLSPFARGGPLQVAADRPLALFACTTLAQHGEQTGGTTGSITGAQRPASAHRLSRPNGRERRCELPLHPRVF